MHILCVSTQWFPFLEKNPVLFQLITAACTLVLGVITIMKSVDKYIERKQQEAQFGFYINLLVYIERLSIIIKEYPDILELFFDERTRQSVFGTQMPEDRAKSVCPILSQLCKDFINYLSTANNNVPPTTSLTDDPKWSKWYEDILMLIRFLHKGELIGKLFFYTSEDQYATYKSERLRIDTLLTNMQEQIRSKLKLEKRPSI